MFKFPNALDIWLAYLKDFIARYGGSKLERLRDMFDQACEAAPANYRCATEWNLVHSKCTLSNYLLNCKYRPFISLASAILYMYYAEQEEKYGLARHAMMIFDRAVRAVDVDLKPKVFNLYLKRATEYERLQFSFFAIGLLCSRCRNFGITRTRQIYEKAITLLPDKYVKGFCLRYANLELKLGGMESHEFMKF